MHGRLVCLITSFAASVITAPVPISPVSPIESPEPLLVREASGEAISPVLDTMKREILERLDAIIQRSVSDNHSFDANDKRDRNFNIAAANDKRNRDFDLAVANDKRDGWRVAADQYDEYGCREDMFEIPSISCLILHARQICSHSL
ncbi:hypothetical protein N0V90_002083 [Kalmusia sp. IMI 367209]|nr:hypothetical protein N0V90_002083 [Kalmusia sp. IMI 367209]